MPAFSRSYHMLTLVVALMLTMPVFGQEQSTLLRLQRSRTTAEMDATGGMRGQGGNILSLGSNPAEMGTSRYPNSASCVVVYDDGRYIVEKRDEHTVGKPKVKVAEGALGKDQLEELKAILESAELKKVTGLKAVEPPSQAQMLREAEVVEAHISHEGSTQYFLALKERFKTQSAGSSDLAGAPSTGLDTYLDNASAYRKTLNPLLKWFDGIEKKSKSSFKESTAQYCSAMTL